MIYDVAGGTTKKRVPEFVVTTIVAYFLSLQTRALHRTNPPWKSFWDNQKRSVDIRILDMMRVVKLEYAAMAPDNGDEPHFGRNAGLFPGPCSGITLDYPNQNGPAAVARQVVMVRRPVD